MGAGFCCKVSGYAEQMGKGMERRLKNTEEKLLALTPPRGRGKRQITDEADLRKKAEGILKKHRVTGLLRYEYEKEAERRTKYVGRGRGPADREKETAVRVRYQIASLALSRTHPRSSAVCESCFPGKKSRKTFGRVLI